MFRYFMWCRNAQFDDYSVIKSLIRLDNTPNQLCQVLLAIKYIFVNSHSLVSTLNRPHINYKQFK